MSARLESGPSGKWARSLILIVRCLHGFPCLSHSFALQKHCHNQPDGWAALVRGTPLRRRQRDRAGIHSSFPATLGRWPAPAVVPATNKQRIWPETVVDQLGLARPVERFANVTSVQAITSGIFNRPGSCRDVTSTRRCHCSGQASLGHLQLRLGL